METGRGIAVSDKEKIVFSCNTLHINFLFLISVYTKCCACGHLIDLLKGVRQANFANLCPKTAEIMEAFDQPKLMTGIPFSFAFFSVLGPHSSIDSHFGPVNLRLRCHFPLILPTQVRKVSNSEDLYGMEIGGQRVQWQLGEPLFFDDSYEHRVWNHSDEERVVLLFDIWHPDLVEQEVEAITDMFQYARQQGWLGARTGTDANVRAPPGTQ